MHVLIISADLFEDSELEIPLRELKSANFKIDVASFKTGTIVGKHGAKINVNQTVDDVRSDDYDLLILPGGKAPEQLRKSVRVIEIVRDFFEHNKPIAAICHGPQILISAGVVKGRKMTAYKSVEPELVKAGAEYIDARVVVDNNLITSRQPSDLPNFINEIKKKLLGKIYV